MSKTRKFTLTERYEYGVPSYQEITDEKEGFIFSASDLTECPEDATLYRDLFNAEDYISAVEFGMKLAQEGYDYIQVEKVEEE